jgi:putative phosphonate metabolism protein
LPATHASRVGDARYAIYFAPPPASPWWRFGCAWLGRDAIADRRVVPPPTADFAAETIERITSAPRLYGFHATLKPPFRLKAGYRSHDVYLQAANLALSLQPAALPPLQLAEIDGFVALTFAAAAPGAQACHAIAAQCVSCFDNLRACPTAAEIARRQRMPLNPRQTQLLAQWGYPYVFDTFRFHLTLSGRLPAQERQQVIAALRPQVDALRGEPLTLNALTVYRQPAHDAPFIATRRYGFDGSIEVYAGDGAP